VHRRLAAAQAALEREFEPTPAVRADILRQRARAMAQEPPQEVEEGATLELHEFVLANERYALESSYVREVYPLKELAPLPCVPRYVLGITNLRGQIVSVIDIKRFFDLPESGLSDLNKVILLSDDGMEFGILADQIVGVRWLARQDLQPVLPTLTGIRAEYLKGVTAERLAVLDAARLIHDGNLVVNEEVGP
jgi:purine-binding chemotaxis protein CheW